MTLDPVIRLRLSTMMFLEFFVWGAWFVTLGTYLAADLGASGDQIALAFLTQSLGAILAPFIVGLIADRWFAARRILGVPHLFSAVMLFLAGRQGEFGAFFVFAALAMISFMPTLALANSISFRRLTSPERQFPAIRVFGTIGWIVAGLLIGWLGWEAGGALENTFVMAAIGSAPLGVYAFTLPHTPPETTGERVTVRDVLGLDALAPLKSRSYLVFFLASILICIPLAFYYNFTNLYLNEIGVQSAAAVQSLGQVSEALFLLVMPLMLRKLGVKWTPLIGMLAWAPRYALFAFGDAGSLLWLVIIGLVAARGLLRLLLRRRADLYRPLRPEARARAAQGLISLATYGVGLLIGSLISGPIVDAFLAADGAHDWRTIWLIPAALAVGVALFFAALFRERETVEAAEVPQGA
ncbi:MFS transporter [Brachybacterium sp. GPGPB12]|uniref:MFS transporter n=1 Tax=Brachybacterium sp. GPGPB12 TaxID=3023517 RepID=UPI0031343652